MSVARTMEEVDSEEFTRWMALDRERPFDEVRWLLLQLTCLFANANRGKDQSPWTLEEFDLFRQQQEPVENEEEKRARVAASVKRAFEALNVVIEKVRGD